MEFQATCFLLGPGWKDTKWCDLHHWCWWDKNTQPCFKIKHRQQASLSVA